MGKGLGISALVFAIISLFVPFFGIIVSGIGVLLAVFSAVAGDRIFATATSVIVGVNIFFLSPLSLGVILQSNGLLLGVLACLAAPFVAIAINASGTFMLRSKVKGY